MPLGRHPSPAAPGSATDLGTLPTPARQREAARSGSAAQPRRRGWEVVTEVSITSERFDELGHDFERDRPVVRGKAGAADVRLFPVADAVAYAVRWLEMHRPRAEEIPTGPCGEM
ncbi:AAC(3) family N-acetyltransferase [Streptomyces sp. AS02]|uniref:AAC(3) family N-acetyltransferase n=1 Tax=Streptomyces sp. AS02 TaxID=2938946 RepID=UPI0027E42C80|nr:AAC(3) family N-acetyltransferase [Streptomyces sp. AS02]